MSKRLDALLSARRDGALNEQECAELDRLLAASEDARRRALDFERVDASLQRLAGEAVSEDRLARGQAALVARLGATKESGTRSRLVSRRRMLAWGVAAAAAIWVASLMLPRVEDGPDDLASLGIAEAGDLEVIEELELLEFLADRENGVEGPRG